MSIHQVGITGMGAVSAAGHGTARLWHSVTDGHHLFSPLPESLVQQTGVRVAATAEPIDATDIFDPPLSNRVDQAVVMAICAADQALGYSGTPTSDEPFFGGDIIAASANGPVTTIHRAVEAITSGVSRAPAIPAVLTASPDTVATLAAQRYGSHGGTEAVSATCASSTIALVTALRRIRHGYARRVLVIGYEDAVNPVNLTGNALVGALSKNADPDQICRPFDTARDGFVMASGAVALLLEADPARPLALLAGGGMGQDSFHPTAADPTGRWAGQTIADALADAGLEPYQIGQISAHATSTPRGDAAEVAALSRIFGARLPGVPVTALKSVTGHLMGGSGALQVAMAVESICAGLIPGTRNLQHPDFSDQIQVVTSTQHWQPSAVLAPSFGFGGHNAAVVITPVESQSP
ncbi:beta-ketoacyl-[acyl-carrier-protein] synthase family protein [Auritidibacter sp. NML120779]|nr:beta-ketoacyl-[acyl-carrier-protein] synthase family protein [Auritidibacter sp. NML120779]